MTEGSPMVIIAGHYLTDADRRDEVIAAFREMVSRSRATADGLVHISVDGDSIDPKRINMVEVWRDSRALDAWRPRSEPPQIDFEMRDFQVVRYDAVDGGPLFP